MNSLLDLNKDLKKYLDDSTGQIISDLKNILLNNTIQYKNGKSWQNIEAMYFEYEYDYLDIIFWAFDKKGEVITETLFLPTDKNSKTDSQSTWDAFLPEAIWRKVADFQDNEEDGYEDMLEEYNEEKYRIFEAWFCACWTNAVKATKINIDAYFSIHDTNYRTDLNTLEEIKDDEIEKRYI